MKNIFLLLVASILLSACEKEKAEATLTIKPTTTDKTVEYFVAHTEERLSTLKACANNPGDLKDDPVCVNAQAAEIKSMKRGGDTPF